MRRSSPPPPPPPANSAYGRYTLVERIAVGGMAEVFLALEPRPVGEPRTVVLKRMLPAIAEEPGAKGMFLAEAKLGELIHHANVVEVLGAGDESGRPYMVLEYVRGLDLWQLMRWMTREGKAMRVPLALYVMQEVLRGLVAVHEVKDADGRALDVVHRDVSPSNVLLSVYGEVKIGDFGIAYSQMRDTLAQPVHGERAKGKLGYLSPEQVKGEDCDQRADVFSAGVIAAELLMGRALFSGGSELAVLLAIRDAKIHPFLEAMPRLPTGLGEAVVASLAANPEDRTASAAALAETLARFQTEDNEALAKELAEYVVDGMVSVQPVMPAEMADDSDRVTMLDVMDDEVPTGRTNRPRTASSIDINDRVTTMPPVPLVPPPAARPTMPEAQAEAVVVRYRVRHPDGSEEGPLSYAQIVQSITTGTIEPKAEVSRGDGPFMRVENDGDLRRHLGGSRFTPTTRQHQAPSDPDRTVDLAQGGFIHALAWSVLEKDTGFWLCEFGGVRKEIYLHEGLPKFVTSNLAGELLGEYLVARGVITRGELDMALAVMPRFEGRLGDTLTALGLVEPVHLFQNIATQVRDKLLDLFMWNGGTASLYLGVEAPESAFPLKLDPWRIIEEGIRRRVEEGHEATRFDGRDDDSLVRMDDVPLTVQRAPLPPDARLLLNTLIKPRTYAQLQEMLPDVPGRKHRAARSVVLLLHLRAIRWVS